eukprot:TRINITY_DN7576_c1_g1_i1.p1 TRINITY_DN7576_c1_g1~~TRINITY_DN7576_c1_g1_i1.p1  ORF type:complete len:113 (+),score=31.16 TRINITY_DN7576_c1_g1_i1:250-588(+)
MPPTEREQRKAECIKTAIAAGTKGSSAMALGSLLGHLGLTYFSPKYRSSIGWRGKLIIYSSIIVGSFYVQAENALTDCVRENNLLTMENLGRPHPTAQQAATTTTTTTTTQQ